MEILLNLGSDKALPLQRRLSDCPEQGNLHIQLELINALKIKMGRAFLLLFLLDQVSSFHYPLRDYYYVNIFTSWYKAREYCKEHYDDIAIFDSMEDIQLLSKPSDFTASYAWIGLLDESAHWKPYMGNSSNSWVWSATGKHSRTGYQNFDTPSEPNNYAASEYCVAMSKNGKWRDVRCIESYHSVCFTETGSDVSYTYVSTPMTWSAAVANCREHHTDLVMIEDEATNTRVINSRPNIRIWIGLSRKPWEWVDGSQFTFKNWPDGLRYKSGSLGCVVEDNEHRWLAVSCSNSNPFICHKVNSLVNKLNVNFQSSANLEEPHVQTQILQQVEAELRVRGHDVSKVMFSIKPQILKQGVSEQASTVAMLT